MIDASLATYTIATLAFAATPGQSTTVVIQQTVDNGWLAGFSAASGCALANIGHATMTRLGLAIVMTRVPQAFVGVRYAGCAYLLWLGGRSLWRAIRPPATEPSAAVADGVAFGQGFITNILNPSIFTYYVVVVPSFMPAGTGTSRYVLLASLHISIAFACHNAWSGLFNQIGHLMRSPRARRAFDTLAGVALTGLAIRLLA